MHHKIIRIHNKISSIAYVNAEWGIVSKNLLKKPIFLLQALELQPTHKGTFFCIFILVYDRNFDLLLM